MCWKLCKLQPRVGLWQSACTGTSFNVCGRFGLSSLQRNPVGNHVTENAFIGIDFIMSLVLVLFKRNSWFLVLEERNMAHVLKCICVCVNTYVSTNNFSLLTGFLKLGL